MKNAAPRRHGRASRAAECNTPLTFRMPQGFPFEADCGSITFVKVIHGIALAGCVPLCARAVWFQHGIWCRPQKGVFL
jgi:hypothetical protein